MIITRTPFRISFFGGGTDYPNYYRQQGGKVLSATINRYCYLVVRKLPPFFEYKYRLRYSKMEHVSRVDEILHPSIRECIRHCAEDGGLEITHTGDIPAMSGMGTSSAFTVGLLHALYASKGVMVTKRKLAYDAIHIEQDVLHEHVGSQDQVAAAFGGLNLIRFGGPDEFFVEPIILPSERLHALQSNLFLFFTGFSRIASEVAKHQIAAIGSRQTELASMRDMVDEALQMLISPTRPIDEFGTLLHQSWMVKRRLSDKISNGDLDAIYERARNAGAIGGKLCGAGGGGFMLLYVPGDRQERFLAEFSGFLQVPFRFDTLGSHIVFYST